MDFDLSADQRQLQGAARLLLDARSGPEQVRAHLADGAPYDAGLWSAMVDQGWCAVAVPEGNVSLRMTFTSIPFE